MKTNFKSLNNQYSYISRFIERKTDLTKQCMICGNKALIQHNRTNPYEIRLLCRECRIKYNIGNNMVDELESDLPTINILEYVNQPFKKYEYRKITKKEMDIIDEAIKNNWTKKETMKKLNAHTEELKFIIRRYSEINPDIKEAFERSSKLGQRNTILNSSLNRTNTDKFNTKIIELKRAKNMSTRDISKKVDGKISINTINLIIEGKLKPSEKFKALIAEALDTEIEKIF